MQILNSAFYWKKIGNKLQTVTANNDVSIGGYLRVGSDTVATNTTAGDLTATRLFVTDQTIVGTAIIGQLGATWVPTTPLDRGLNSNFIATPGATSNGAFAIGGLIDVQPTGNNTGTFYGLYFQSQHSAGNFTVGGLYGAYLVASSDLNTITTEVGAAVQVNANGGTVTTAIGWDTLIAGAGAITTAIGLRIQPYQFIAPSTQIGIEIATQGTKTLWVAYNTDPTTAAGGIFFGSSADTNLYRSAANILKTDDSLTVGTNLTVSGGTVTLTVDTDFVLSGGVNGMSIDGTTFSVDGTNNRVGIGTAAPGSLLSLNGAASGTGGLGAYYDSANYGIRGVFQHGGNSGGILNSGGLQIAAQGTSQATAGSSNIIFFTTGANSAGDSTDGTYVERMRILSGGTIQITTANATGLTTSSGVSITANSLTTGTGLDVVSTSLTSGILARFAPSFTGSAVGGIGVEIAGTDSTTNANTDYNLYSVLSLSGNAAKTGIALLSAVSSSSNTADAVYASLFQASGSGTGGHTIVGVDSQIASTATGVGADTLYGFLINATTTGIITSGTRTIYNLYAGANSTAANTGGTSNMYGLITGMTHTVGVGGTANTWGVYIANNGMNTTGTTKNIGLHIDAMTGADNNYDMSFGTVDGTAAGAYYGRIPVLYNGLLKYVHVFSA